MVPFYLLEHSSKLLDPTECHAYALEQISLGLLSTNPDPLLIGSDTPGDLGTVEHPVQLPPAPHQGDLKLGHVLSINIPLLLLHIEQTFGLPFHFH